MSYDVDPEDCNETHHAMGNGGIECAENIMDQMLSMVSNEKQGDWDKHLPHIESAYNNLLRAGTYPDDL